MKLLAGFAAGFATGCLITFLGILGDPELDPHRRADAIQNRRPRYERA